VDADVVLVTRRLGGVVDWQPEDLTVVVEGGMPVADLEAMLAERNQTAVLPEDTAVPPGGAASPSGGGATVGGVVAAGISGWRRLGYGPTRDRMLEVRLVTGDGRIVTAGGRVVKNVTGYDLPRLATGSFGALGIVGAVCLKLWPSPAATGTIPVADAAVARRVAYRPLAIVETGTGASVYVAGTPEAVAGQAADLGSAAAPGLVWPAPLTTAWVLSLRVPAADTSAAAARARRFPGCTSWRAAHGVGEVTLGLDHVEAEPFADLRRWAEGRRGALVVVRRPDGDGGTIDPWGAVPAGIEIQRRIKAAFDPAGIVNPGRLPGRL
jgi:glycolate oxidase FAD binding subunit